MPPRRRPRSTPSASPIFLSSEPLPFAETIICALGANICIGVSPLKQVAGGGDAAQRRRPVAERISIFAVAPHARAEAGDGPHSPRFPVRHACAGLSRRAVAE